VSKLLGARQCLTGWACSFGERVVLVLETIDVGKGLPGTVRRVTCDGLEGIPDAMKELLGDLPAPSAKPETKEPAAWPARADLADVFARIPSDDLLETYPDDAWRALATLREGDGDVSVEQAEHLLAQTLEHARRLREDPRYRAEWVVRTNVRRHPLLSDRKFTVISRAPFLVFADLAVADVKEAARVGDALSGLAAEVHRLVAEPNGLPRVGEVLKVLILPEAEGKELTGTPLPPGVAGYYSPRDRGLYLFAGREGEDPDTVLRRLVHDATHQLMHALAKAGVGKKRGKPVEWNDPALRPRMLWLSEGFAELMAGAMLPGARGFDIDVPHLGRRAEWKNCREAKKDDWPFDALIKMSTTRDMQRKAFDIGLNRMEVSRLSSLFYAQAWSFTFFLWHAEDGRYRDRLRAALAGEVTGGRGRFAWQEQWFEKGTPEDWGPLEKEWRAWEEAQSKED
jgi:hypothetical protein